MLMEASGASSEGAPGASGGGAGGIASSSSSTSSTSSTRVSAAAPEGHDAASMAFLKWTQAHLSMLPKPTGSCELCNAAHAIRASNTAKIAGSPGECCGGGFRQTCLTLALRCRLGSGTPEAAAGWDQRHTQSPVAALHTRPRAHHTCRRFSMRLQAGAQPHAALSSGFRCMRGNPLGCKTILQPHQDEVWRDHRHCRGSLQGLSVVKVAVAGRCHDHFMARLGRLHSSADALQGAQISHVLTQPSYNPALQSVIADGKH